MAPSSDLPSPPPPGFINGAKALNGTHATGHSAGPKEGLTNRSSLGSPMSFDSQPSMESHMTLESRQTVDSQTSVESEPSTEKSSPPPRKKGARVSFAVDDGYTHDHHHSHKLDTGSSTLPQPKKSHRIQSFGIHEDDSPGASRHRAKIRSWGEDASKPAFPRLSKPVELMRGSYDCVVIGSGYGGGVAAARMARAGETVCVLERGKERWPGEYPSDTGDALDQVHYSGEFSPGWLPKRLVKGGDPTGMFHLIFGNGQNAFVGNGASCYFWPDC
jgi:hypothetical protein